MPDPCDRCGQRAYTAWWRATDRSELDFCGHCLRANQGALESSLMRAGYVLARDSRAELLSDTREPEPA